VKGNASRRIAESTIVKTCNFGFFKKTEITFKFPLYQRLKKVKASKTPVVIKILFKNFSNIVYFATLVFIIVRHYLSSW